MSAIEFPVVLIVLSVLWYLLFFGISWVTLIGSLLCFILPFVFDAKTSEGRLLATYMALSIYFVSWRLIKTNKNSVRCDGSCNQGRTQCECKND